MNHTTFVLTLCAAALIFLVLSILVIISRRKSQMAYGVNDSRLFQARVRAHANFAEYAPICLLLLYTLGTSSTNSVLVASLSIIFIIGRISHAIGLLIYEQKKEMVILPRQIGMMCTFTCILLSVAGLLMSIL